MTLDADGREVDWTAPPYYVRGVLTLLLPGEDPRKVTDAVEWQRAAEYLRQRKRAAPRRSRPK